MGRNGGIWGGKSPALLGEAGAPVSRGRRVFRVQRDPAEMGGMEWKREGWKGMGKGMGWGKGMEGDGKRDGGGIGERGNYVCIYGARGGREEG